MFDGVLDTSSAAFEAQVSEMRKLGMCDCVGQEAILALPDVIQRELHVPIVFTESLIFRLSNTQIIGPPLQIAFYKGLGEGPGHNRTVLTMHETILPYKAKRMYLDKKLKKYQFFVFLHSLVQLFIPHLIVYSFLNSINF